MVDLTAVRNASPVIHAILALVLLMTATVLAVSKPLGMTPYGRRKQGPIATSTIGWKITPRWIYLGAIVAIAILLVVVLHLSLLPSGTRPQVYDSPLCFPRLL